MSLLSTIRGGFDLRASVPDPTSDFWYTPFAGATASGVPIGPETAMKASAVFACVRLISETVASLPIIMYARRADGGKDRAIDHPLYDLLHDEPCAEPRMTAFQWKSTCMAHLLLRGNAYCRIVPGPRGAVDQLRLLHPDRVEPTLNGNVLTYKLLKGDGSTEILNYEDVFHLTGLSLDGVTGVSIIAYARETIGLSLAAEGYAARVFAQDATPRGVLKHPSRLSKDAIESLRASWSERHAGLGNAHKPAILEEGMTWEAISMTAEDAQLIAGREFQVVDIARWFNVPLHMIQETARSTSWGSGIEHMSLGFLVYTLLPWLRRWEDTISQQLITLPQRYFAEFLVDALLRGNTIDRYNAYAVGRMWGWLSVNDILAMENRNPVEGGDGRLQPLNMVPLGTAPAPVQGDSPQITPQETTVASTFAASPLLAPLSSNGDAHPTALDALKEMVNGNGRH